MFAYITCRQTNIYTDRHTYRHAVTIPSSAGGDLKINFFSSLFKFVLNPNVNS